MQARTFAKTAVLNTEGKVLLLRRSSTDPQRPGEQDFPGGNVEPGEDVSKAAAREIKEEAGLTMAPSSLLLLYAATELYEKDDVSVTRLLFVGTSDDSDVVLSSEHDEYQWVEIAQAIEKFPHHFYTVGLEYAAEHNLLPR